MTLREETGKQLSNQTFVNALPLTTVSLIVEMSFRRNSVFKGLIDCMYVIVDLIIFAALF
jgi:hypothetical protein